VRRVWLDLGDPGVFVASAGPLERWQDHGLGLLRTILHRANVRTDVLSVRSARSWRSLARKLARYQMLLMNVRSYTFPLAARAARLFKQRSPRGVVIVGGLHASVAPEEMERVTAFDTIVQGPAEGNVAELVVHHGELPRVVTGVPLPSMADWPLIDRTLWPRPRLKRYPWPLEPACGWGPSPVATVLTSRVCPWRCAFCNEASYIPPIERRPVEHVIDELNRLDREHGPLGSVVIHDSMFFQHPHWLEEWLDAYPRRARRPWPYWAAARSDQVRRRPELFEALVKETNWSTVSIGFESGSAAVLRTLNKECTVEDNAFTIDLLNRIGDETAAAGGDPPRFWANLMLGNPGETREDAFATMRMLRRMRHALPSIAFYAPYPGSALGYQLIAEGRSLMTADDYHRYPSDEKMPGIDYPFYRDLLAGRYDEEIDRRPWPDGPSPAAVRRTGASGFFLFETTTRRHKLAYGTDPEDAVATLALRLGAEELQTVRPDRWVRVRQQDLRRYRDDLG
jgi:radical SAM superfamily enzyme YgiQ (UPF0313 family)